MFESFKTKKSSFYSPVPKSAGLNHMLLHNFRQEPGIFMVIVGFCTRNTSVFVRISVNGYE